LKNSKVDIGTWGSRIDLYLKRS